MFPGRLCFEEIADDLTSTSSGGFPLPIDIALLRHTLWNSKGSKIVGHCSWWDSDHGICSYFATGAME